MHRAFIEITSLHVIVFISLILLMAGCERGKNTRPEEIKATVRHEIEQIWNSGNLVAADEIIAEHYVLHESAEEIEGLGAFIAFVTAFRAAFPDAHFDIDDMINEGDRVVLRYTFRGKHDGEYVGITPTGKEVTATGICYHRVADGKLQETWNYIDKLSVLTQLGWWVPLESWQLAYTWPEPMESKIAEPGDPDKNKIRAQRGLAELWSTGDLAIVDEVYSENFINHEITHRQFCDRASYKKYVAVIHHVVHNFKVVVDDLIAERDRVAIRWQVSGTDRATGNGYAWGGITIFRFSDNKIIEAWWSRDALSVAQQMGIVPMLEE